MPTTIADPTADGTPTITLDDLDEAAAWTAVLQDRGADVDDVQICVHHEMELADQFVAQHPDGVDQLNGAAAAWARDYDAAAATGEDRGTWTRAQPAQAAELAAEAEPAYVAEAADSAGPDIG